MQSCIANRFNYYIKSWKHKQSVKVPDHAKVFNQNKLLYYTGPDTPPPDGFPHHYGVWEEMFWWPQGDLGLDIPCLTISADGINSHGLPVIAKVRYIDDPDGAIIGPLSYNRHWNAIQHKDGPRTYKGSWKDKRPDCVWRGAPTGGVHAENERLVFCSKWRDAFNVGLTGYLRHQLQPVFDPSYLRPSMSIHEMLDYKYIISIPGNDKDSGLNWKLASNSVVLMAPPKMESWLMEGLLEPWVHYVPLKDDYSDLDEIVRWCRENDHKCQEIVKNANGFMRQFENEDIEIALFRKIKEHYKETFTLV